MPEGASAAALIAVLTVAAVEDARRMIVPNACIIAAVLARAALLAAAFACGEEEAWVELQESLAGAFGIAVPIVVLATVVEGRRGAPALGGGDVKLLFAVGLYLGFERTVVALLLACMLALLAVALRRLRSGKAVSAFPFAPAIAIATGAVMLAC